MTRAQLISQVVLRMDEFTPDTIIPESIPIDGGDNNPLYQVVDSLLDDGALEVYSVAPYWRLPQKAFLNIGSAEVYTDPSATPHSILRLKIEDDFLRVAEINADFFQRPVTEAFPEQSPEGRRQHNIFLMGRENKPVAIMSHGMWGDQNPTPCREIDVYSFVDGAYDLSQVVAAFYIPKPVIATTGNIAFPPALIPALVWVVAGMAFAARGDANHAAICNQYAKDLIV